MCCCFDNNVVYYVIEMLEICITIVAIDAEYVLLTVCIFHPQVLAFYHEWVILSR